MLTTLLILAALALWVDIAAAGNKGSPASIRIAP